MISTQRQYILGITSVCLGIYSYIPYLYDMSKGETKPHIFSWILRGIGARIVFAGQISDGAGAGAWSSFITGCVSAGIVIYAYFHRGKKYITASDCILFGFAVIAIMLYTITDNWWRSIMIINIADIISLTLTIRKSRNHPYTETISLYIITIFEFAISIGATATYTFITVSNSIIRILLYIIFVIIIYHICNYSLSTPQSHLILIISSSYHAKRNLLRRRTKRNPYAARTVESTSRGKGKGE